MKNDHAITTLLDSALTNTEANVLFLIKLVRDIMDAADVSDGTTQKSLDAAATDIVLALSVLTKLAQEALNKSLADDNDM